MESLKIYKMTMTEKFKVLAKYIKDMSSETPDVETFLFVKDNISKYQLNIDINSKALKNKLIEVNTTLKFEDKEANKKKSYYEIVYSSIVKVDDDVKDKKDLEKIILCDVQNKIYPDLENSFLNLIHNSGHPNIKLEKKIDFDRLYSERSN
jgi:preprotein translocase subunit SecB